MKSPRSLLFSASVLLLLIDPSVSMPMDAFDSLREITEGLFGGVMDIVEGTGGLIGNITGGGSEDLGKTIGNVLDAASNATGSFIEDAIKNGPQIFNSSVVVFQGIAKTSNDSQPIIKNGVEEYNRHAVLASKFISAYTKVNMENFGNFMKFLAARLRCNTECATIKKESPERASCEEKYCVEFKPPKSFNLSPEDYVDPAAPSDDKKEDENKEDEATV